MAKRFLTHIDLEQNQILNASFEKLSADPLTGLFEGRMYYNTASDTIRVYTGTSWIPVGAITNVQGTADEVEVTVTNGVATVGLPSTINANTTGNAATATKLATARTIELTGDVTGTATFDGSANASITATIAANSVELGTDTTGNYVASVSGSDGVSVTGTGEGAAVTIANTDKGSSQNIFKNVVVGSTTIIADNNDDTLTIAAGTGIGLQGNATTDTVTISNEGVTSLTGTANQIAVSGSTGSVTLSLPSAVTFPGTVTLNADPTQPLQAATKQYVDSVAEGLHIHASVGAATTANIADLGDPPAQIDGVTLTDGMRILVKNQSNQAQNGIYVYVASTTELIRASDFNSAAEIQGGDFVFVTGGNTYDNTGWVQTATVTTLGTDPIVWDQFSGAGTYLAGNGLTLNGNTFSINTAITADLNSIQTLTNKTLTSPSITNPSVSGLYLTDNTIVVEGTDNTFETTINFTDPTADRTITFKDESGTVAYTSDITSAINGLPAAGYTRKYSLTIGNGTNTSYTVNHNLGTRDVQVQVYDTTTYDTVEVDVIRTDTNNVTVAFSVAPASNAYRVVVVG